MQQSKFNNLDIDTLKINLKQNFKNKYSKLTKKENN